MVRGGEIVQQFKALVLAEEPGSISSTHAVAYNFVIAFLRNLHRNQAYTPAAKHSYT